VSQQSLQKTRPAAISGKPPGKASHGSKKTEENRLGQNSTAVRRKTTPKKIPITAQREKLALNFSRKHHPELADLLNGLRATNRTHYENGLRELARDADRLGKLEQRDDGRFSLSLQIWKLDSRIRLEAARFSLNPSPEIEDELRRLMLDRQTARLEYLKLERQRMQIRIDRLNDQIRTASKNPEHVVSTELDRLRKLLAAKGRNRRESTSLRRTDTAAPTPSVQNTSASQVKPGRKAAPSRSEKPSSRGNPD